MKLITKTFVAIESFNTPDTQILERNSMHREKNSRHIVITATDIKRWRKPGQKKEKLGILFFKMSLAHHTQKNWSLIYAIESAYLAPVVGSSCDSNVVYLVGIKGIMYLNSYLNIRQECPLKTDKRIIEANRITQ